MILSFESGDYVLRSYEKFHKEHFPENYNNHSIDLNKIRLENWQLYRGGNGCRRQEQQCAWQCNESNLPLVPQEVL